MKKTNFIITSTLATILLFGCASTPEAEVGEKHSVHEKSAKTAKTALTVQKSQEEVFLESIEGITIKKESSPKEITLGKEFSAPFVFSVAKADGTPISRDTGLAELLHLVHRAAQVMGTVER